MKFFVFLLFSMLAFSSCRKNYSCTCSTINSSGNIVDPRLYDLKERKESTALSKCQAKYESEKTYQGKVNCQLE